MQRDTDKGIWVGVVAAVAALCLGYVLASAFDNRTRIQRIDAGKVTRH